MPPNFADVPPMDAEVATKNNESKKMQKDGKSENVILDSIQWGANSLGHTMIGAVVTLCLWFALRNILTTPLTVTQQHIILCVIGYPLLMGEAILCFASGNGWSHPLKLKHKRMVHWLMQISGSTLAISGSLLYMTDKASRGSANFVSNHGIMGLVAFTCTVISLVNGLASLYAFELRKIFNANFSKMSHIFFGSAAFIFANVCLCLGLDKNSFRNWASSEFAHVLMGIIGIYTLIVIFNPFLSCRGRLKSLISK